jgi:hypothetical protein
MPLVLAMAAAVLVLLVLAFGFAIAWLVWGDDPFDPNRGDD